MTVTRFDGASLPLGWSAVEPAGGHVTPVAGSHVALQSDAGADFDSLSSGITVPEGPRLQRSVSGSFDYAVGFASSAINAVDQGVDLLALDEPNNDGIRFAQFTAGSITTRNPSWFGYRHDTGADAEVSLTDPTSNLYGARAWMRLTYDASTSTWTFRSSQTGKPGTWHTHASFTSPLDPETFEIGWTAFGPDSNGREMRVALVVDMDGRSDDATTIPGVLETSSAYSTDFSGGLPSWLTAETNAGGTVSASGGVVTMTTDCDVTDSYAWLNGPTDLDENHGVLIRLRFPQPSVDNSFAGIAVHAADSTTLPASDVVEGKYRPGTGLLAEVNGSAAGGGEPKGEIFRVLTAQPIATGETYDSTEEFYGFSNLIEDEDAPVDGSTGDWIWLRLETFNGYFRSKVWYDGDPEPSTWTYEGEEWTQQAGTGASVAWSHNDSSGSGVSTFEIGDLELYELAKAADVTASVDLSLAVAPVGDTPDPPVDEAEATASIDLSLTVAPTVRVPPVAAIDLGLDLAPVTETDHDASANLSSLGLDVTAQTQADHETAAAVGLGFDLTAGTVAAHDVAASVDLSLALAPLVERPPRASIPLAVAMAPVVEADHQVAAAVGIVVDLGAHISAPAEPTYRFFPPVQQEGPGVPPSEPYYVRRLFPTRAQGISLVIDPDSGLFVEKRYLTEDDYSGKVNGVDYFVGGYRYKSVPKPVADLLTASGYTPELEVS